MAHKKILETTSILHRVDKLQLGYIFPITLDVPDFHKLLPTIYSEGDAVELCFQVSCNCLTQRLPMRSFHLTALVQLD